MSAYGEERPGSEYSAVRGVVNPLKTRLEMSEGKIKLSEHAVYNGSIKVVHAAPFVDDECAWLYLAAESRDGMNITLTEEQTRELRDLLSEVLELHADRLNTDNDRQGVEQ